MSIINPVLYSALCCRNGICNLIFHLLTSLKFKRADEKIVKSFELRLQISNIINYTYFILDESKQPSPIFYIKSLFENFS